MQLRSTQVIKSDYAINGAIVILWIVSAVLWLASLFRVAWVTGNCLMSHDS